MEEYQQGPWRVELDSWLLKGRRKRKATRQNRLVLLTLFVYHLPTALSWLSLLSAQRLPQPSVSPTHVPLHRSLYEDYKHTQHQQQQQQQQSAEMYASWPLEQLAEEVFSCLQNMSLASANGRTNVQDADTRGHLLSSAVGAMTSR
eukprot:5912406-Amphidinium_carterae.1